jgi:hypothetical protein
MADSCISMRKGHRGGEASGERSRGMAKKLLKQSVSDYMEPVNGVCVGCGHRVRSSWTIFCKKCGMALMPYKRSMRLALMYSLIAVAFGLAFNVIILQFDWVLIAVILAMLFLRAIDSVYLKWQSSNHQIPEMRILALAGGWFLSLIGAVIALWDFSLLGFSMLGLGVAVLIVVHFPFLRIKDSVIS